METLRKVVNWYGSLTKRGKSLVVIATAAVIFLVIEGLKQ